MILRSQPASGIEGYLLAAEIERIQARGTLRRLEDGPVGGTPIYLGEEHKGDVLDCPLPTEGPWPVAGISDLTLAQTGWQLERGTLLLPGETGASPSVIPIAQIGETASAGFSDMEIIGDQPNGVPQGPFRLIKPATTGAPTYPILWAHNSKFERELIVATDAEGQIRLLPNATAKRFRSGAATPRQHRSPRACGMLKRISAMMPPACGRPRRAPTTTAICVSTRSPSLSP